MKQQNSVVKIAVAALILSGMVASSQATVMDESTLGSFTVPGNNLYVDWMVMDASAFGYEGDYAYLYQLEVPSNAGTQPEIYTVTFDTSQTILASFIAGDNLDDLTAFHPAHTVVGEHEGFSLAGNDVVATINSDNVTWLLVNGLAQGSQSPLLYFIDPRPPVPGFAGSQDGTPPSPWSSLAPGGETVPVPGGSRVPDAAATMTMLGAALSALGLFGRKIAVA